MAVGGAEFFESLPRTPEASQNRGIVFEKDGTADWAPDLGPGCGPVPLKPIAPKDKRPTPGPTFRKVSSGLRNGGTGGLPEAPLEAVAPLDRSNFGDQSAMPEDTDANPTDCLVAEVAP